MLILGQSKNSFLQISIQLDAVSEKCRDDLVASGHSLTLADLDRDEFAEVCRAICTSLRVQGFGSADDSESVRFMILSI